VLLAVLADEMYSNRFLDYISHYKNMFTRFMVFTCAGSVEDFVSNSRIDVLLVDGNMVSGIQHLDNIQKIIILSGGDCIEKTDYPVIFKYQSAEHILKEIFSQIADDNTIAGITPVYASKQLEMMAVFSPSGGMGASTYARNLCSSMAENNSVLYINMELFDSFAEFEKNPGGRDGYIRGMSEVVFFIKQRRNKFAYKLEALVKQHNSGYSYILPAGDYRDLYSITPDDMEYFTDVLIKETVYGRIVFDVGYISEAVLKLFGICDVLLLPEPSGIIQENKYNSFKRLLSHNGMEKITDNFRIIPMKERGMPY